MFPIETIPQFLLYLGVYILIGWVIAGFVERYGFYRKRDWHPEFKTWMFLPVITWPIFYLAVLWTYLFIAIVLTIGLSIEKVTDAVAKRIWRNPPTVVLEELRREHYKAHGSWPGHKTVEKWKRQHNLTSDA